MNKEVPLNERLRAALPELGGQLALAGQYLTQYPQDVAVCSMREIARRAAVPPVTLVRLAQRLSLSGWRELREHYVDGVLAHSATGASAATRNIESARAIVAATRASAGLLDFAQTFLAAEQELLRVAFAELNEAALGEAVSLLAEADRVFVVGRRTPFPAAFALAYALRKARPGVVLLDDAGGAPEAEFEDAGPQDVLVAVTFAPFSRVTWTIAERAAASGARIVAISDIPSAPVRRLAEPTFFLAPTASRAFPESVAPALTICNLLAALALAKLGEPAQERVLANEQRLIASGEYLEGAKRSRRRR